VVAVVVVEEQAELGVGKEVGGAKPRRQEVKAEWAEWTKPSGMVPLVHNDAQ